MANSHRQPVKRVVAMSSVMAVKGSEEEMMDPGAFHEFYVSVTAPR